MRKPSDWILQHKCIRITFTMLRTAWISATVWFLCQSEHLLHAHEQQTHGFGPWLTSCTIRGADCLCYVGQLTKSIVCIGCCNMSAVTHKPTAPRRWWLLLFKPSSPRSCQQSPAKLGSPHLHCLCSTLTARIPFTAKDSRGPRIRAGREEDSCWNCQLHTDEEICVLEEPPGSFLNMFW